MSDASVLRLIISLIFIIALILACAWAARRAGWTQSGGQKAVRVLSSQSLGGRAHVTLVEVENARLLLGVTSNQISLLHTLPPAEPGIQNSTPAANDTLSFAVALGKVLKRR